jgi:hypothetical protein
MALKQYLWLFAALAFLASGSYGTRISLEDLYSAPADQLPELLSATFGNKSSFSINSLDTSSTALREDPSSFTPSVHNLRKGLAYYTMAAYCNHFVDLKRFDCGHFCDNSPQGTVVHSVIKHFITGAGGFIAVNNNLNHILVVWEGSLDIQDWLVTNIRMGLVPVNLPGGTYPNMRMHEGFLRAFQSVSEQVYDALEYLTKRYPSYRVVFTGHSLGGAMSIVSSMFAIDRLSLNPAQTEVVTFGQPRVGNKDVGRFFRDRNVSVVRYVHQSDIIPHLPTPLQGYSHHHTEEWIVGSKVRNCHNPLMEEDPTCSRSAWFLNVIDHAKYLGIWWNPMLCRR